MVLTTVSQFEQEAVVADSLATFQEQVALNASQHSTYLGSQLMSAYNFQSWVVAATAQAVAATAQIHSASVTANQTLSIAASQLNQNASLLAAAALERDLAYNVSVAANQSMNVAVAVLQDHNRAIGISSTLYT